MSRCEECKHFLCEYDINFFGCANDMDDKYWDGTEECPEFKLIEPDPDMEHDNI